MKTTVCSALVALLLAGCQTATKPRTLSAGEFDSPIRPGETRLSLRNIDRDKWIGQRADTLSAAKTQFICKPLACPAPSVVVYTRMASPTRKPDPQALLALGRSIADKAVSQGVVLRSQPKLGTIKGFPSVSFAADKEVNGKMEYGRWVIVFAGSLAFNLQSISQDEAAAGRNLNQFISTIEIVDGGSRQSAAR